MYLIGIQMDGQINEPRDPEVCKHNLTVAWKWDGQDLSNWIFL